MSPVWRQIRPGAWGVTYSVVTKEKTRRLFVGWDSLAVALIALGWIIAVVRLLLERLT